MLRIRLIFSRVNDIAKDEKEIGYKSSCCIIHYTWGLSKIREVLLFRFESLRGMISVGTEINPVYYTLILVAYSYGNPTAYIIIRKGENAP